MSSNNNITVGHIGGSFGNEATDTVAVSNDTPWVSPFSPPEDVLDLADGDRLMIGNNLLFYVFGTNADCVIGRNAGGVKMIVKKSDVVGWSEHVTDFHIMKYEKGDKVMQRSLRKRIQKMPEVEVRQLLVDLEEELRGREMMRRWEERIGIVEIEEIEPGIIDRWSRGLKY